GSAGSAGTTPTSALTSASSGEPPAVEDVPTKTSTPAPAPAPVSQIPLSSEPTAQPAEASTTPSTDAVASAAAVVPQEQSMETSKDISSQDAKEISETKVDGAK